MLSSPGLKQALAVVNDYNPLMKDFPLNDLLSATELDRIRVAVQAIFNHMRKIRTTKYPIQRALRLLEAISRDLSTQMLKVLSTRRLMHIPFEEFEKVSGVGLETLKVCVEVIRVNSETLHVSCCCNVSFPNLHWLFTAC